MGVGRAVGPNGNCRNGPVRSPRFVKRSFRTRAMATMDFSVRLIASTRVFSMADAIDNGASCWAATGVISKDKSANEVM